MPETTAPEKKSSRILKLVLKIVITIACLWYVTTKIDFGKSLALLQTVNWFFLLFAFFLFIISKIIASYRLNIYFSNIGIHLPQIPHMKLYWLGMFYNLFLPGSISGDAYKVIMLSKKYDVPYKKTTAAVLLDRISGLLGLGILLAIYAMIILPDKKFKILIVAAAIIGILALYIITRYYMRDFSTSFFPTLLLGILVQLTQVLAIYCIMASLKIPLQESGYIFIFLLSSIAAVLPLTIGPLGIRELVFVEGARWFALNGELSVAISLLFFLITLIGSAWGMVYVFRSPLGGETKT